jgi:two-component system, chemotaxis family, protein-glutamate methylesterase/glutaminase
LAASKEQLDLMTATTPILPKKAQPSAASPIRVMLVDDSNIARSIFSRILGESKELQIVAEAIDSSDALSKLETIVVDVILLDIEMPKRSGLEALPDILEAANGARVIVVSSFVEENGAAAIQALSLGACDTLAKPGKSGFGGQFSNLLVEKVIRLGRSSRKGQKPAVPSFDPFDLVEPACIAIGASTGGIPVIYKLIQALDPKLECPIFIVQHLPHAFMDFFAKQLAAHTNRPVSVAAQGIEVLPGRIYVAPGDAHLMCKQLRGKIVIDHVSEYTDSRYCPSVDALFSSVAQTYGSTALAIVLSGMGNDGVAGARLLSAKGSQILVQDAETSVVWGMPGAVARENLAQGILSPDELSRMLSKVVSR